MVIKRIDHKHYQFVTTGFAEGQHSAAAIDRDAIRAEIRTRAYQLWRRQSVRKDAPELDWLIDGRLMGDLATLSYQQLVRINRRLTEQLTGAGGSKPHDAA